MTAKEIVGLLAARYADTPWLFVPEMTLTYKTEESRQERRVDAYALHLWPSQLEAISFEIKVDRHDWLRELESPEKRAGALRWSHRFYIVAPEGIVRAAELPPECGLMVAAPGSLDEVRRAPKRKPDEPSWYFMQAVIRSIAWERKAHHDAAFWEGYAHVVGERGENAGEVLANADPP